ncbi:MAG: DUF4426 domain-containing protein [Xanthomonadales bacterium]|nr:DUF4426 domain-containing protein [Xanthomonadales bacterium]
MASSRFVPALFLCLLLCCAAALAEQSVENDTHVVHFNALSTDKLTPEVARAYGIMRSQNRAMLNITVMKKGGEGALDQPTTGDVSASATNLTGQRRDLEMRLIEDQDAIYYIGMVRVADQETLDFSIQVLVDGAEEPLTATFRQQFFVD